VSEAQVTLPDGVKAKITYTSLDQLNATVADLAKTHAKKPAAEPTWQDKFKEFMTKPRGPVPKPGSGLAGFDKGASAALDSVAEVAEHPLNAAGAAIKGLPKMVGNIAGVATHPIESTTNLMKNIYNLTPEKTGELLGTAGVGMLTGKGYGALGELFGPAVKAALPAKALNPDVARLASEGVTMTPGQRGGKFAQNIEQKLRSLPIAGVQIGAARTKAIEQWNKARLDEVLRDAGGKPIPKGVTGRDALKHVYQELRDRYGQVLGKMRGDLNQGTGVTKAVVPHGTISSAPAPGSFREALENVRNVGQGLPVDERNTLNRIIDQEVIGKFTSSGRASGEVLKKIDEKLRLESEKFGKGGPYQRDLAQAIRQIHSDFNSMLKRVNAAKHAAELERVDRGYAKYKTAEKASLAAVKNEGVYSPAQKLQAIRARDKSKDKGKFARGEAPGQKEAQGAERVLGNEVQDSGTAGRVAVMEMLRNPQRIPVELVTLIGTTGLYSQPVLRWLQNKALKSGNQRITPGGPTWKQIAAGMASTQREPQKGEQP
jgi:hypothetical protein